MEGSKYIPAIALMFTAVVPRPEAELALRTVHFFRLHSITGGTVLPASIVHSDAVPGQNFGTSYGHMHAQILACADMYIQTSKIPGPA